MNLIRKSNSILPNRLAGCRTGATAVEFALIVPLFLVMTIGASDVTVSASYDYEFLFSISGLLDLASSSTGTSIPFTLNATSKAPLIME